MATDMKTLKPALATAFLSIQDVALFLLACLATTASHLVSLSHLFLQSPPSLQKPQQSRRLSVATPRPRLRRSSSTTTAVCYSPRNSLCEGSPSLTLPPLPPSPAVDDHEFHDAREDVELDMGLEEDMGIAPVVELVNPFAATSKRNSGIWVERIVVEEVVVVSSSS
ncbi:hypothetical protein JCM6882_003264 [Rhodosporidiobolus microsporus]